MQRDGVTTTPRTHTTAVITQCFLNRLSCSLTEQTMPFLVGRKSSRKCLRPPPLPRARRNVNNHRRGRQIRRRASGTADTELLVQILGDDPGGNRNKRQSRTSVTSTNPK